MGESRVLTAHQHNQATFMSVYTGKYKIEDKLKTWKIQKLHCVQKKNTHSHFLSYLHELFVDFNKNCSECTQGLIDSDNVKIRYSLRSMT